MNRPLVNLFVAYAAGLLLGQICKPPAALLLAITGFVLVLFLALKQFRYLVCWPLLALAGWSNLLWHTTDVSPDDLRTLIGDAPALVTVHGELAETPRLKITVHDEQENWRSVTRVRVTRIRQADAWVPATGEILVTTPAIVSPDFFAGQPVEISGILARPPPPLAEGLFDFQNYLATRGLYYQLKADATNDWSLLPSARVPPPLADRFLSWSRQTLALGLPAEDEPLRLIWAMTLGWRTAFTGDIGEPFLRAGTMHLFAIDGLRIALLSGMLVALLRTVRLARAWCGAIAVPAIWFYTAATGWEPSAIRASVMMTIVLGGWALKRPGDLLNSLAAAAFVILLADPRELFEASFQLSFLVMLVIALMLPRLNAGFDWLLKRDELLPDELMPGWKKSGRWLLKKFLRYTGLSFAAWIGSLPLAAKYFHLFSPVSTLVNLVAVPLGTGALMANLGALVSGHWLPWVTGLFNHAAWFFMVALTWLSVEAAKLPCAYYYVPEPSLTTIAVFYGAVIALFSGWFTTRRRIRSGLTVLIFLGGFYGWQWQSSRAETDLTLLPLNGGHAIYVDADGRKNDWLINCGNENAVNFTLKDYLRAQGVNTLPRLILTVGDTRNAGGAHRLDELFAIGELWTSPMKFRSPAYRNAVAAFEADDSPPAVDHPPGPSRHHLLNSGDTAGCWQVLFPTTTNAVAKADDRPLVLRGNFHGTKVLLLSDLSRIGQSDLLASTNDLRADIVIAGLPAKGEPLCDALIDASQPKVVVIADSDFPATRRASRALHERLAQKSLPVIYTRTAGAVKIAVDQAGWKLATRDGQEFSSATSSK
jgi:competence protein ComEC